MRVSQWVCPCGSYVFCFFFRCPCVAYAFLPAFRLRLTQWVFSVFPKPFSCLRAPACLRLMVGFGVFFLFEASNISSNEWAASLKGRLEGWSAKRGGKILSRDPQRLAGSRAVEPHLAVVVKTVLGSHFGELVNSPIWRLIHLCAGPAIGSGWPREASLVGCSVFVLRVFLTTNESNNKWIQPKEQRGVTYGQNLCYLGLEGMVNCEPWGFSTRFLMETHE